MRRAGLSVGIALIAANASAEEATGKVSLQDAVTRALSRNPTAIVAAEEIRRSEALVAQVRATSLPTIVGTGIYTRLDDDRTLGDRVIASRDQLSANVTVTVPLIHPKAWAQWSHAKDGVSVASAQYGDTRRAVAVAVARAYLTVVAQKRVLDVTVRARDTAKAHHDFAHQRFTGGVGNKIDDVRAEQELMTDESQVHTARALVDKSREALGVVVGVEGPLDTDENADLPKTPALDVALGRADKRPDVLALGERTRLAERTVRDNWTDYSPMLSAIGQPFYQNPPSLVQPLTGWQVQLVLTIPFYDGGLRYGLAREREAVLNEARVSQQALLRQARSEVRSAFQSMERADDALKAARDAATLAKQAYDLAELAYRAGATTNIELIDAQRRARDADAQVAIAEDSARQARLDLLAASGRFP